MGRLDGKVAVITGAAGGIGREAALLFSSEGARVCVADVGKEAGEKTASECREAFFFQADVSDPKSVEAMYEAAAKRFGKVDVLYNNAGIMPADDDSILTTEPEAWDRVQAVNARGVFLCCKYGIPHLLRAGGGSVINVASFVALMGAATSQIAYTASKGAVLSMCRVHMPMGRLAKAKEIAHAALFLASDDSSYVNGSTFVVDGGITAAYVTPE